MCQSLTVLVNPLFEKPLVRKADKECKLILRLPHNQSVARFCKNQSYLEVRLLASSRCSWPENDIPIFLILIKFSDLIGEYFKIASFLFWSHSQQFASSNTIGHEEEETRFSKSSSLWKKIKLFQFKKYFESNSVSGQIVLHEIWASSAFKVSSTSCMRRPTTTFDVFSFDVFQRRPNLFQDKTLQLDFAFLQHPKRDWERRFLDFRLFTFQV